MPKIGLSVSFCIQDIIKGKVDEVEVEKIIGSTCCYTYQDWEKVAKSYRASYWQSNPELGESIMWRLIASGKIDQPRVKNEDPSVRINRIRNNPSGWIEEETSHA